jgi:hypoxanthine phosphoribosyltransferase
VPGSTLRCELISWHRVYRLAERLAFAIRDSGYRPEVIVAIARGGYVPARILCDFLGVYALTSIRVVHYAGGARKQPVAQVTERLCTDITGKRILIVDDVSDTGDTYKAAIEHLAAFRPAGIRTAVLLHKIAASYQPDFIGRRVIKWRWKIYPWAVIEDVSGFLARMEPPPRGEAVIRRRLQADYGLRLPAATLRLVLRLLEPGSRDA